LKAEGKGHGTVPVITRPEYDINDINDKSPYLVVTDAAGMETVVKALEETNLVGLDVETTGLDPRKDRVRLLSVATDRGIHLVDCFRVDPRRLWPPLTTKTLLVHNGSFDVGFLATMELAPSSVRDTMLMSRLLYGTREARGFHSLEACAERELGRKLQKEHQKSDWSQELTSEQLAYAAHDVGVLRFQAACRATAGLLRAGHAVFSPIVHGHPLVGHGLPVDWTFWGRVDREHLARCDEVVVLMLDGWRESVGVQEEIRVAQELGKPVRYLASDVDRPAR
jgi:hypothetical protein